MSVLDLDIFRKLNYIDSFGLPVTPYLCLRNAGFTTEEQVGL